MIHSYQGLVSVRLGVPLGLVARVARGKPEAGTVSTTVISLFGLRCRSGLADRLARKSQDCEQGVFH
jgi:hypothetical protein